MIKKLVLLSILLTGYYCNPISENKNAGKNDKLSEFREIEIYSSKFKSAVNNVGQIDYELKKYEELESDYNLLTNRIDEINRYRKEYNKELITQVNISNIIKVRKAFLKGTINLGNNTFERADIESWEVSNEEEAIYLFNEINQIKESKNWKDISKSPITCFRIGREIIFITPGGFYMLSKVQKISDHIRSNF